MKNSKKVVLTLIIVLIVIILLGGGAFAYAYFFTDIFLSEQQGFYKYISQNSQILEIFEDEDLDKYIEKCDNDAHTNNAELSIGLTGNLDERTQQLVDEIQKHKITVNSSVDKVNKYAYGEVKLVYGENDVISGAVINNNDYYGLKIDDIGLNPYIVLENNNLKEFARNLGLSEDEIASIPDKINFTSTQSSITFTDAEKAEMKDRYSNAIKGNLTEDMFSKSEQDGMTVYTLTLTSEKAQPILNSLIETLKNDDMLLNKIKQIYIEQQNVTESEAQNMINEFKTTLQELQDELNGTTTSENNYYVEDYIEDNNSLYTITDNIETDTEIEETVVDDNLYISVYVSDKNLVKTEAYVNGGGKIVLNKGTNKVSLEFLSEEDAVYKTAVIDIEKIKTESELSYKLTIAGNENKEIANITLNYTGLNGMTTISSNLLTNINFSNTLTGTVQENAQDSIEDSASLVEEQTVKAFLVTLSSEMLQDSYLSNEEVVLNETTLKDAVTKNNLDMTVSTNIDGTFRLESNSTGYVYTVNSQCELTNTEAPLSMETDNIVDITDEIIDTTETEKDMTLSLNYSNTLTFGAIQQQEQLTESNMYVVNTKSLEQLQNLFTQLGQRIQAKISSTYQNSTLGQMITQ